MKRLLKVLLIIAIFCSYTTPTIIKADTIVDGDYRVGANIYQVLYSKKESSVYECIKLNNNSCDDYVGVAGLLFKGIESTYELTPNVLLIESEFFGKNGSEKYTRTDTSTRSSRYGGGTCQISHTFFKDSHGESSGRVDYSDPCNQYSTDTNEPPEIPINQTKGSFTAKFKPSSSSFENFSISEDSKMKLVFNGNPNKIYSITLTASAQSIEYNNKTRLIEYKEIPCSSITVAGKKLNKSCQTTLEARGQVATFDVTPMTSSKYYSYLVTSEFPSEKSSLTSPSPSGTTAPRTLATNSTTQINKYNTVAKSLKIGTEGTEVEEIQTILMNEGYLKLPAGAKKGYYGQITQDAVEKYKKDMATSNQQVFSSASCLQDKKFAIGDKGEEITYLQNVLIKNGYLVMPKGAALGYYGEVTKNALAKYQASCNTTAPVINPGNPLYSAILGSSTVATSTTFKLATITFVASKAAENKQVYAGERIQISGKGFKTSGATRVWFGLEEGKITQFGDDLIYVTAPSSLKAGKESVFLSGPARSDVRSNTVIVDVIAKKQPTPSSTVQSTPTVQSYTYPTTSVTPTTTVTPTATVTSMPTPTVTQTSTPTPSVTTSPSSTPTPSSTATPSSSASPSSSPRASNTSFTAAIWNSIVSALGF